jgi:PhnB protein
MTNITPYLTFNGNCREAMTFYQECFGGNLELMPFEGSPMASQVPPELLQNIMHAQLTQGGITLMASDKMTPNELIKGNTITLSLNCSSEAEINRFYANLSAGGTISMPLSDQFWGAKFAMLTDKFGINWMLNFDKN